METGRERRNTVCYSVMLGLLSRTMGSYTGFHSFRRRTLALRCIERQRHGSLACAAPAQRFTASGFLGATIVMDLIAGINVSHPFSLSFASEVRSGWGKSQVEGGLAAPTDSAIHLVSL